jgi:hypothetical protein
MGMPKEESLLNQICKSVQPAAIALMLIIAILLGMIGASELPDLAGQRVTARRQGSSDAPFLPQRIHSKILTAQPSPKTTSAAAENIGILACGLSAAGLEEMLARLSSRQNDLVHLLFMLRNNSLDRAPPYLT